MSDQSTQSTNDESEVVNTFKSLFSDTQALLQLTENASGKEIKELRARLENQLQKAQSTLGNVRLSMQTAAGNAEEYMRRNPWQAISIGLGVGTGIGMLLGVLAAR